VISTLKPEVVYVPAIFREIRVGRIRVPSFQRGYVWREDQALSLLDSVREGYPIGSLLFWRASNDAMRTELSEDIPFPHPDVQGEVNFVLDGMQRISTLFGAFHRPTWSSDDSDSFAVVYDLATRDFLPIKDATDACINLRSLFEPRAMLAEQARLAELANGDALVDESLELHRAFQNYLVPIVTIGEHDAGKVVEIFERVNSTGTSLGAVDFMRALTWSSDFDLTNELQVLADRVVDLGFIVPTDTLAKCVALRMGIVPKSDEMIFLRRSEPQELRDAVESIGGAVATVAMYLSDKIGLGSYDFVPYEGQWQIMVSAAATLGSDQDLPDWFERWYWRTGFSEAFFGRPDKTIASDVESVCADITQPLHPHFSLSTDGLARRAMIKGKALAMTMYAAMASRPPHSVYTGVELDPWYFLRGYDLRTLGPVFSKEELASCIVPRPRSDKLITNVVLLGPDDHIGRSATGGVRDAIRALATTADGRAALESQFIAGDGLSAVLAGDCSGFLRDRGERLVSLAKTLSNEGS